MKNYIFLVLCIIICFFSNLFLLNTNYSFNDILNLLFYNYKSFYLYGYDVVSIVHIIHFYLLYIFTLNIYISSINENSSFLSLVIYKNGRLNMLKDILKQNVKKTIVIILIFNIIISILAYTVGLHSFNTYMLTLNIYFIKYFLIILFIMIFQSLSAIKGEFSNNLMKINFGIIILIIIDIIFKANIITFSNNIKVEMMYILIYTFLFVISISVITVRYKKGGKND